MSEFVDRLSITDESGNFKKEININFGDPLAREQSQKAMQTSEQAMQTSEQAKQTANEAKQIAQEAKDAVPGQVSQQVEEATRELSGQIVEAKQTADEAKTEVQNVGVKKGMVQWTDNEIVNNCIRGCELRTTGNGIVTSASGAGSAGSATFWLQGDKETQEVYLHSKYPAHVNSSTRTTRAYNGLSPVHQTLGSAVNVIFVFDFGEKYELIERINGVEFKLNVPYLIGHLNESATVQSEVNTLDSSVELTSSVAWLLAKTVLPSLEYGLIYKNLEDEDYILSTKKLSDSPLIFSSDYPKAKTTESILKCDCTGVTDFRKTFTGSAVYANPNLKYINLYNFKPVGDGMTNMLYLVKLEKLAFTGEIDTSGVTSLEQTFAGMEKKGSLDISMLDFSNVTSYFKAFSNTIRRRYVRGVLNSSSEKAMFEQARIILPNVISENVGKGIDTRSMFYSCDFDNCSVPFLSTAKISKASSMFSYCKFVKELSIACDFSISNSMGSVLSKCYLLSTFTGFRNVKISYSIEDSPLLTHESALNCIAGLYDLTEGGTVTEYTAQTLTFHPDVKAQLTEEEIAEATAKGWNIA